jgi:polysaccharide biosynthesis transport protein
MDNGLVTIPASADGSAVDSRFGDKSESLLPPPHPFDRPIAAVRRYKWVIAATVILAGLAGVAGTRLIAPQFEARATIWIASEAPVTQTNAGPIRSGELLRSGAWIELFRSYRIVDEVVRELSLYLEPKNPNDAPLFSGFTLAQRFVPGEYQLDINRDRKSWVLQTSGSILVERGTADDSVGRRVGFAWHLPESAFQGSGDVSVNFRVSTPRETSIRVVERLTPRLVSGSNFLWLSYRDRDPKIAAKTLNTWVNEYIRVAADLKKHNIVEFASILEGQLKYAETATQDAETAYQRFRVNAITLPTEGGPVAAGVVERDRDPALQSFFEQKIEHDNLRHDREALEKSIANATAASVPYEGLLLIPSVAQSPGAEALREAFRTRYQVQARLTAERQHFTDEYATVKELKSTLDVLEHNTIPLLANQLLAQLRERELDYERRISAASKELQSIPPRTIEERRLNRAVVVSEGLYTNLKSRYAEAKLAEASTTPDVSVLDTAIAPLAPTKNTATMLVLFAIVAGFGLAIGLALMLDKLDGKFRYIDQVLSELGVGVAGAVPRIPKSGMNSRSPEQVLQFVESFRALRMHVISARRTGERLRLAVTSAAPGDGKSLVAANLALSFGEAGLRTVLVDGDTRRGSLHRLFGQKAQDGLTEYLSGITDYTQIVKNTSHDNLSFVSCGRRDHHGPELLASNRLKTLVDHLSQRFDVVILDSPPLAAGIDGYAIAAAAGSALLVLRMGRTERRLALAKLAIMDRLPVDILGAALNEVPLDGDFQYYAYATTYSDEPASVDRLVGSESR